MRKLAVITVVLLGLIAVNTTADAQVTITDPGQGPVAIGDPNATGAEELSGLVKVPAVFAASASAFQAVGDNATTLYNLTAPVNPDGTLASASLDSGQALTGTGSDLEGIAYTFNPGAPLWSALLVVSEAGPAVSLVNPTTFAKSFDYVLPTAYTSPGNYNASFGLESLATGPDGTSYTANEQALTADAAGRVRIQSYKPDFPYLPDKQVAYEITSPVGDFLENPLNPGQLLVAANGVVDLAALPNGDLLVLERALGFTANGLQTRATISHIAAGDFAAATDTLNNASLDGSETVVAKTELWSAFFGDQNYEGLAIGETLASGELSLLLVSDNGQLSANTPAGSLVFNPGQTLYALTVVPEPTAAAVLLGTGAMLLRRQ